MFEEALELSREADDPSGVARAYRLLGFLTARQGDFDGGRRFFEHALAMRQSLGGEMSEEQLQETAQSLEGLADVEWTAGDHAAGRAHAEEALGIYRKLGLKRRLPFLLSLLGGIANMQKDWEAARAFFGEVVTVSRELGSPVGEAHARNGLAEIARDTGDLPEARRQFEQGLAVYRNLGFRRGVLQQLLPLAGVVTELGDLREAIAMYEEAVEIARETGDRQGEAQALDGLGRVTSDEEPEAAAKLHAEALALFMDIDNPSAVAEQMARLARLFRLLGRPHNAVRLLAAAESSSSTAESAALLRTLTPDLHRTEVAALREILPAEEFERCWAEGSAMSLDQASATASGATSS